MIEVTELNGAVRYVNADLIERIEQVPETLLTMVTGRRYMTREEPAEIVRRIEEFRQRCHAVSSLIA